MSLELFINIFKEKGFEIILVENELHFDFDDLKARFPVDEIWSKSIKSFFKSKQYEFDSNSRVLTAYRSVEFQIIRIDSSFLPRPFYEFEDERKNKVIVTTASKDFSLALLSSDDNDKVIDVRFHHVVL